MEYDGKDFNDPILRCDQCSKITHRDFISKHAGCSHCGNKRFKNVRGLSQEEYSGLKNRTLAIGKKAYEIDKDFLSLFEGVEDE
jgi:DNA-directed RNA polymerase subunit RPC12/RpoP